jgi:hypothetical protein
MEQEVDLPPIFPDTLEYIFQLTWFAHITWHNDPRLKCVSDRAHVGFGLVVKVRDSQLCARLPKHPSAARRNTVLIGDADYQPAFAG